jgi:hypothetical protein
MQDCVNNFVEWRTINNVATSVFCIIVAVNVTVFIFKKRKDVILLEGVLWLIAVLFFAAGFTNAARIITLYFGSCIPELIIGSCLAFFCGALAFAIIPIVKRAAKIKTPRQYENILAKQAQRLMRLQYENRALQKRI